MASDLMPTSNQQAAISWPAILGGATAAASLSLILMVVGTGLGLASVSPWANTGISEKGFDIGTVAWIILTPTIASIIGGYLCGRLRARWLQTHTDEVRFRDAAHGFLAWAAATIMTVAIFAVTVNIFIQRVPPLGMVQDLAIPTEYYTNKLFRKIPITSAEQMPSQIPLQIPLQIQAAAVIENNRIFAKSLSTGQVAKDDLIYLTQQIRYYAGISEIEADKRLRTVFSDAQAQLEESTVMAKRGFDEARKNSAYASMWFILSLLCSAVAACFAATLGGKRRDNEQLV
jgi:hypothetical protein